LKSRADDRLNDSRSFEKLALRDTSAGPCRARVMQFTLHIVSTKKYKMAEHMLECNMYVCCVDLENVKCIFNNGFRQTQ
jgi:hypothetical protein